MKKILIKCLLLLTLPLGVDVNANPKLSIVYTSNQPNILLEQSTAHFPQLSSLINQLRENPDNRTLFLHGGDSFSPSPISLFDTAKNIISLANLMEVTAYATSKRELTYDVDTLSLRALDAQFPILASNLIDKRTEEDIEGLFSIYEIDVDGVSVAIVSIINPRVLVAYRPANAELKSNDKVLAEAMLQMEGADLKILMTDLERDPSVAIAKKYPFDIVFVAHEGRDEVIELKNNIVVLGGGQDGDAIVVEYQKSLAKPINATVVDLSVFKADPEITDFVDKYKQRLGNIFEEVVAQSASEFTSLKKVIRTQENALGNVFADALRELTGTDVAFVNSGSMRSNRTYPIGYQFTRGDIQRELPFGNYHAVVDISGAQLMQMIENSVSRIEYTDGRFLNVSGMNGSYDSSLAAGARVKWIKVAGEPVVANQIYTATVNSFYLRGGDDYTFLKRKQARNSILERQRIWHIVAEYFVNQKIITASPLGRMVDLAKDEN